jgi:hypothetical protein
VPHVIFISGHLNLSQAEFEEHYLGQLRSAHQSGAHFVVGDARGCDRWAQEALASMASTVTVFHMFDQPRNNVGGFPTRGGFRSDDERDAAMTASSSEDLAWVRPGRERSGTAKNLTRRSLR